MERKTRDYGGYIVSGNLVLSRSSVLPRITNKISISRIWVSNFARFLGGLVGGGDVGDVGDVVQHVRVRIRLHGDPPGYTICEYVPRRSIDPLGPKPKQRSGLSAGHPSDFFLGSHHCATPFCAWPHLLLRA